MHRRRWLFAVTLSLLAGRSFAEDALPAQSEYEPPQGKGQLVVFISGQSGPGNYAHVAKDLAAKGYYTVLLDGNEIFVKGGAGEGRLRGVLERSLQSPHALPGKAAVVGASLGGGATIAYAARMPDLVAAAVAFYPYTAFITDPRAFVAKIKVPTLVLAGARDTYKNCCVIETARRLAEEAKSAGGDPVLELHEYPDAEHGWDIQKPKEYRSDIAADSLRRTLEFLQRHPGS